MKAVILAGGQGSRLQSISGGTPKPMMPLLGKPILEHIVRLLTANGFDDIRMTLCYKPEMITEYFADSAMFGARISFCRETCPRGTAGAVKNCRDFIGSEDFLVISGDCVCDFDLAALAARHREVHADATIVLTERDEPLPYGNVLTEPDGRVIGFLEKPDWPHVVTDRISAGIYFLTNRVLDDIPDTGSYDFGKDLFPAMLREKKPLYAFTAEGYWCDVGTPEDYYRCNLDALHGKLRPNSGSADASILFPCRSRARLMRHMSEALAEYACGLTDGLLLDKGGRRARVSPCSEQSAIRIEGEELWCSFLEKTAAELENGLQND